VIWRLIKNLTSKTTKDENAISNIAKLWCYYYQYVGHEKTIVQKIEHFRNSQRDKFTDKLIYQGISLGAVWDDGENNDVHNCLDTHFLSEEQS